MKTMKSKVTVQEKMFPKHKPDREAVSRAQHSERPCESEASQGPMPRWDAQTAQLGTACGCGSRFSHPAGSSTDGQALQKVSGVLLKLNTHLPSDPAFHSQVLTAETPGHIPGRHFTAAKHGQSPQAAQGDTQPACIAEA